MSLLNVDVKWILKVLSNRIKNLLPNLISNNQNAYVAYRFISEGVRLISDILEMTDILNMEGYLLMILRKPLTLLTTVFYLLFQKNMAFKKNFLRWIETLLNNQESCIINERIKTHYLPRRSDLCVLVYSSIRSCILCN